MSNDFIDQIMGFDPQNLDAFKEQSSSNYDENIYKNNPVKFNEEAKQWTQKFAALF